MISDADRSAAEAVTDAAAQRLAPLGVVVRAVEVNEAVGESDPAVICFRRGSTIVGALRFELAGDLADAADRMRSARAIAEDLWRLQVGEQTVAQLATRIDQAYEQAHLLFRLARIPENVDACQAALADAIERLHGITNLGWVVLHFNDQPLALPALRGRQFQAGQPPVDAETFRSLIVAAATDGSIDHPIQTQDRSPLARATGAEVLLQPLSFEGQRLGLLAAGNNGGDDPGLSSFETQLFAACAGYLDTFHANLARIAQQEAMFLGTLRALVASIDAKDPYTCGHSERVALLAHDMAIALGLGETTAERYRIAGLVHDIGKIGVPETVLRKAGRLSEDEFAHVRKHPQIGFEILANIPGLDDVRPGVLHHHERFDGRGYPHGLAGEEIPLLARVLALADTFDAMSSNRSYRSKLRRDDVLAELRRCGGAQFDAALTATFVAMDFARFDAALRTHADLFPAAAAAVGPNLARAA